MGYEYQDDEYLIPKTEHSRKKVSNNYSSIKDAEAGSTSVAANKDKGEVLQTCSGSIAQIMSTVPAVLLLALWNIMLSIPFGSMFFSDEVPLDVGVKEKLGLRMSLMALGIGQILMGGNLSSFDALTLWELAEVAPFYSSFAQIAARNCGDDTSKIYPTTAYLISLSTICVGISYFVCGAFRIGKFISFFPSYVILGIIAGIGVWAAQQSITVSISPHIFEGSEENTILDYIITPHFALSLFLGLAIRPVRVLIPSERFLLLDPVYFLSIPVGFYCVLYAFGISFDDVVEAGYTFRAPVENTTAIEDQPSILQEAVELWTMFDISKVQWEVAFKAVPQIFATAILGVLVSAPFVPPIATLLDTEKFSLDREFVGHGISNVVSGLIVPGGVPMCACYSSTVLYVNSGGKGKFANYLLAATSFISVVYGPLLGGYLPRCMASAILIDIGINLFLEGVADPKNKCDPLEYCSIWVILTVMNVFDQTSGLIAALFMALFTSTYASSSDNPVRRMCDAATFPSSCRRNEAEMTILDDPDTGRKKIAIFQLQGSVFFGNIAKLQDQILNYLVKRGMQDSIIIFDFTLVSSLDSSACIFFDKIQTTLKKDYGVAAIVFVASPSKLEVEKASEKRESLMLRSQKPRRHKANSIIAHSNEINPSLAFGEHSIGSQQTHHKRRSTMTMRGSFDYSSAQQHHVQISGTCFEYLDKALARCEDKLLHMANVPISLLAIPDFLPPIENDDPQLGMAFQMLNDYCRVKETEALKLIIKSMKREIVPKGTRLWNMGDHGVSAKLLLRGSVFAFVSDDDDQYRFRSITPPGSFLGLRSLILNERHLVTARCEDDCIFYSLDTETYQRLVKEAPEAARVLQLSLARYLSHKLRHVSNRIYQARSLPI